MTKNATAKPVKKEASAPKKKAAAEKPAVKKVEKVEKKASKAEGKIRIQQVASSAGKITNQIKSLKGLGLNKVNKISEVEDTPSVRGMINKVKHLLKILK